MQLGSRPSQRRVLLAAVTVTALIALAGCAGGGGGSSSADPSEPGGTIVQDATVTVGEVDEPPSWNIYAQSGVRSGNSQWGNIFEPLVVYNYDTREFDGVLATDWEMDGRVWTFHLREGVTFSDGQPFTAEDVIFSLDRIKNHPESLQVSNVKAIESMRAIDDLTVEITLKDVLVSFLANLDARMIMAKHPFDELPEQEAMEAMIGTGPYKLDEWNQGAEITLERNENYWGEEPTVKTLVLRAIPDDSARLAALTAGEVDLIRELPMQNVPQVKATQGIKVIENEGTRMIMFPFNPTIEPFGDIRVRQAISYAIDNNALIENILGGTMRPMNGPLPSTIAGYNPEWPEHEFDPDKAKALVEEIGGGQPVPIEFWAPNGNYPGDREMAQAIVQMLTDVGFDVTLNSPDFAVISQNLDDGKMGFYMISKGNYVDAGDVLQQYFQTGVTLRTMYENPDVNALLESQATEQDPAARLEQITQAADIIREDVAADWLGTYDNLWAAREGVDWTPTATERILGKDITVYE